MITLNSIKSKSPCKNGWEILLKSFDKTQSDDTEITIDHLLDSNGVDDTLWTIANCIENELINKNNMFADFAESAIKHAEGVLGIFEKEYSADNRPRLAILAAKNCVALLRNPAARAAARAVGDAARAAARAAGDAAWDAAWDAARASWAAAEKLERENQKQIILKYFGDK